MLSGYPGMKDLVTPHPYSGETASGSTKHGQGHAPTWKQTLGTSEPEWVESRRFRFTLPRVDGQYRGACPYFQNLTQPFHA